MCVDVGTDVFSSTDNEKLTNHEKEAWFFGQKVIKILKAAALEQCM
jgi:hypothetical protein